MSTVTDYVAAGSFADLRKNVTYLNETNYAQLIRTVDLKKKFTNNDFVYVDENAFEYLWRVNLDEECIVLPNIGANIGEVYYVQPSDLPYENNVLGPNAILLKTNEDNYFVFTTLNTALFQKKLFENVGASGQPKFNKTELKSITLEMPSLEEQKQIGSYFIRLDHLITLHQRKCDETKKLKKFMLQKMFPKDGKKVPEIRFEGFTEDWEQRKLGELGEIMTGSTPSTSNSEYYSEDGIPWVTPTDINSQTISDTPRKLSEEGMKVGRVVPANTILCTCIASIGKNTLLTVKGSFNQQINCLTPNEYNDAYFLLTESVFWSNIMKRMAAAGTMQIVNKTEFSELTTMVPKLEEQKKIGQYFRALDHLITLHQRKCDKLQEIKKYMLQNMFI